MTTEYVQATMLRDNGMAIVTNNHPETSAEIYARIATLAKERKPFTADHVLDHFPGQELGNVVGAAFMKASRAGLIVPTGHRRNSRRKTNHARDLKEWIGTESQI